MYTEHKYRQHAPIWLLAFTILSESSGYLQRRPPLTSCGWSKMALKSPKPRAPENSPKILRKSSSGLMLLPPLQYCWCPAPAWPASNPAEPYVSYCFLFPSSLSTWGQNNQSLIIPHRCQNKLSQSKRFKPHRPQLAVQTSPSLEGRLC